MVGNAVSEMRRYYSRKVIDVLIKVTKTSLDILRKQFIIDEAESNTNGTMEKTQKATSDSMKPLFVVHSKLMIPNIVIRPTLDELQEALITAGKNITGVAKGVAQWTSGKDVYPFSFIFLLRNFEILNLRELFTIFLNISIFDLTFVIVLI